MWDVTREAASSGFERFVEDALTHAEREFSVSRALGDASGAAGAAVDRLLANSEAVHEHVVRPELDAYRRRILAQFDVLLDCVESDAEIDAYRERLLETDAYAANLRSGLSADRRRTVRDRLLDRQRGLAEAVRPLVAAPSDDFWDAVDDAYDRAEMRRVVEKHFVFTGPLENHRPAFRMTTTIDPGTVLGGGLVVDRLPAFEVEYTDEALRSLQVAERRVVSETKEDIERRY